MVAWLIIAGVLLLGHASALAEPYLRVRKNGVIYYYFNTRPAPHPGQGRINPPPLRTIPPESQARPTRGEVEASVPGPSPHPYLPETANDFPVVNPPDAKEYILAGARLLIGFMTPWACGSPLSLAGDSPGLRLAARHQSSPYLQERQTGPPELGEKFLKYAQEQLAQWDRMNQGSERLWGSGPLLYCFPVSYPFSFRDTWGDFRSGGRIHRAVDIQAPEGAAVYAVTAGVVHTLATYSEAGITLLMQGLDGRGYGYMHLQGYAPGIVEGKAVSAGELIGYVGRTGLRTSAAHLHFQVYADHRLGRGELLNPYNFLVQLCRGVGVTDLYHHQIASLHVPQERVNQIQVYRRPRSATFMDRNRQRIVKDSSVLVIRNF